MTRHNNIRPGWLDVLSRLLVWIAVGFMAGAIAWQVTHGS